MLEDRLEGDASLDVKLNPVEIPSGEIVAWAIAFPRVIMREIDV